MAKTFKNLPLPELSVPAKRAPERDFFDLSDDSQSTPTADLMPKVDANPVATVELGIMGNQRHSDNTGNTPHTSNPSTKKRAGSGNRSGGGSGHENTGVISNTGNTTRPGVLNHAQVQEPAGAVMPAAGGRDVRQTFVLSQGHLEQLRDHVHARRIGGDYNYSQKQALQAALDLLFASTTPVSPRPEQVRELEQQRRERIHQGRLSRK